ncbi:hypothetical protein D3C71_1488300 [compost metagenome]
MRVADARQRGLVRAHHHGLAAPDDGGGLTTVGRQKLGLGAKAARAAGRPHLDRAGDEEVGDGRRRRPGLMRRSDVGDAHPHRARLGIGQLRDVEALAQFIADLAVHLAEDRAPVLVRKHGVDDAEDLGRGHPQAGDGRGQRLIPPLHHRGAHHVRARRQPLVARQEAGVRRRAGAGAGARRQGQARHAQAAHHSLRHGRLPGS